MVWLLVLGVAAPAGAQLDGAADDAAAPVPTVAPTPNPLLVPTATSTSSSSDDRPARGPAVRDRGSRRSRGGSAASGALLIALFVGVVGYYIVRRLRR